MMLTIHGLPISTKYHDLKVLVKQQCNLTDFILDNLVSEGDGTKRVRIGVTDEREGSYLMKCLNGYRMSGNILKVAVMGKAPGPQQNFDQHSGYPTRENYNPSGSDYSRPMDGPRPDPWGPGSNQWGQGQSMPNQPVQNYNYQHQGPQSSVHQSYGQQQAPHGPRPHFDQRDQFPPARMPAQDQRYGFPSKNNMSDPMQAQGQRRVEARSHVLRSVEIIDEPLGRPIAQPARFPPQHYEAPQKPITIMKDNFQGPPHGDRQSGHPPGQYHGHNQESSWNQQGPSAKSQAFPKPTSTQYDKKYSESDKRGGQGPRFSPRRDLPKEGPGPRFSPRRDTAKDGPRFSPRRDPKDGPRFSPRRDIKDGPRFSPRRDKDGPRFSPRRDKDGSRFSPRRDHPRDGPRFSPRKDGPTFSPRRDVAKDHVPRFSPRRDVGKDGRGPRFSPRRDIPKDGPRFSPRRDVPMNPHGRRESPHTRRLSPGRRISPSGRRISPSDRRMSRRDSPGPKRPSPTRRESPSRQHGLRFSPTRRHHDKPVDKYGPPDSRASVKDVRPAYEPTQAPNQAMYSGGYRPSIHENIQYPAPVRQPDQDSTWQQDRNKPMFTGPMKKDEDRRDMARMPKFEPRLSDANLEVKRSRSPLRKSRSPNRRDRSPVRDRYKKHSPSRSPRRSWALEKRRSPELTDAPPPPIWPGQSGDRDNYRNRPNFPERGDVDKSKRLPVWEHPSYVDKGDRRERRPEEERRFPEEKPVRVRTDLSARPLVAQATHMDPNRHNFNPAEAGRFPQREPKFEPREDFPDRRNDFRRPDDARKPYDRSDFRDGRRPTDREETRQEVYNRHGERRDEFPRNEERKDLGKGHHELNKEIDDVYKRAVEFNKRAQEMRRSNDRRDEYSEGRSRRVADPNDSKDYERHGYGDSRHHEDSRHPDERRQDAPTHHLRDEMGQNQDPEWEIGENKLKREKAVDDIACRMLAKHGSSLNQDLKRRVLEEIRLTVGKALRNMFGNQDVSFIEMVIKFNAKYNDKEKQKMFNEVMSVFPNQHRAMKRTAEEPIKLSEVPAKTAKHSPGPILNRDVSSTMIEGHISDWTGNLMPADVPLIPIQQFEMVPQIQMIQPLMVQAPPFVSTYEEINKVAELQQCPSFTDIPKDDGHNLFLCKDDFEPFTERQAEYLKKYLISQLIRVSQTGGRWAPDFTLKGLQSQYRYELVTKDDITKDWILHLDFTTFSLFNVLVYTKEELWYERAAIWLPGHSRCRNIEPLTKLKLQNKKLEGVQIGKWKFVKKVLTVKGTRIYVDMPPSSARALERHKMTLSYELQKVSVFLKAVAVDKDSFDAGLREMSINDPAEIITAAQNSPMPSLGHDPNIIKIALKGNKSLSVVQARKIKEMIIYHIFKYHQDGGSSKTDFSRYGYCMPGFFGVIPENVDSRRWLQSLNIGKLNRHAIVILNAEEANTRYIKMTVSVRAETVINKYLITERLKQSNQGVKGLNFSLWKPLHVYHNEHEKKAKLEVDIDMESIETLSTMKYQLDYIDSRNFQHTVTVKYDYSYTKLEEVIKKHKAELNDSYDVANMDIASSDDDDDDIVYLGEVK